MKTLVIITMISVVVLADSSRRMPSKQVSIIETNWIALPPSPVKTKQMDTAVVRSNLWEINGTNRTLLSTQKIGIMSRGLRTNYMVFNPEESKRFVPQLNTWYTNGPKRRTVTGNVGVDDDGDFYLSPGKPFLYTNKNIDYHSATQWRKIDP